ncbi:hypothetical protein BC941DRAFT_453798 [Chlamydoabsidia padenii]|nr:hypothetical protein BC941DRAFT_453798 [Chlamydoabsidia padenii]
MSSTKEQQVASLIGELSKSTNDYDYEYSLLLCDQLLKLEGENDTLALHCKVITLIRLEKYSDALALIGRHFRDNKTIDLSFEKLYCYYRTNQWQQAFDLLDTVKISHSNDTALKFLEAQLLYAQDEFQQAIDIYEDLIRGVDEQDPIYEEVQVNLMAAKAGLIFLQPDATISDFTATPVDHSGYEYTYNLASIYLAQGDYTRASELLEQTRKQCNERAKDHGLDQNQVDEELAVIVTQLAYTYQVQGRIKEAMDIYQDIVASKIRDTAVNAVVANNMMTIQKTDDLFDAAKKMKMATGKEADTKFKQYQKRIITMNEALLQMYMNKHGSCRETIQGLIKQYPDMDDLYVILASATYHQQQPKTEKALQELISFTNQHPSSLAIRFATIQLELLSSQPAAALNTLQDYLHHTDKRLPGVVALLVWLYEQTGQADKAMQVLDQASSSHWKSTRHLLKQTAAFKLKTGRFSDAAMDYEQLVKEDPTDTRAIAGWIAAYAEIDVDKAEQYNQALPAISTTHSFDIDELESVVPGVKKGYMKKDPSSTHIKKLTIKKKKRHPLLPKHYDENKIPDPERWVPTRDRSTYRIKGKKASSRGSQGMTLEGGGMGSTGSARLAGRPLELSSHKELVDPPPPSHKNTTNKSSSSNKKKKKGGKNKW